MIEAGVPFKLVKQALNFDISKIVGLLVSHSHKDHAAYIQEYIRGGIPVFAPSMDCVPGALSAVSQPFAVRTFPLVHDVDCTGFLVEHPDIGRLLFATDTEYVRYRFKNLNHILVEANYDQELIDASKGNRNHIMTGHMSIGTACDFLAANNNPDLRNVVLIHLSDSNSDERDFTAKAKQIVSCPVCVADKGLEIEL